MLVELIVLDIEQNTVLSPIPICSLNITSKRMPKINKTLPITIDILRYFVVSMSFLINWDKIRNNPNNPKNIISFPFEDPIKKRYVIGLIIGLSKSVMKMMPASIIKINPIMIVLFTFINNNLILIL